MSTTCKSCVTKHWLEVSHDNGTTWFEVPAVRRSQKGFEDQDNTKVRHSQSGGKKVDICGADSRTENYTVTAFFCDDDPLVWYLRDGDIAWFRRYKERGNTLSKETFQAKVQFSGDDWDNDSEEAEEREFVLETSSPVALEQYTGGSTEPYRSNAGSGFYGIHADSTAAVASLANSGSPVADDFFFSTTTETYHQYDGVAWNDTGSDSPP